MVLGLVLIACVAGPAPGPSSSSTPVAQGHTGDQPAGHSAAEGDHSGGAPIVPMYGFSFVDDTLAGMPLPDAYDLPWLVDQEIALLVSARTEPFDAELLAGEGIDAMHLPIEDFHAPTLDQQVAFVAAVDERRTRGEKVGVHCTAGLGRTGTLIATWFVSEGAAPQAAIDRTRSLRPGSIETTEQEASVFTFSASLQATP